MEDDDFADDDPFGPAEDEDNPYRVNVAKELTWRAFKDRLANRYLAYPHEVRRGFLFRGHSSSKHRLQPTIDRLSRQFKCDEERNIYLSSLLQEFRKCSYGIQTSNEVPRSVDEPEWEYLGRHHGLPTTILDWTRSPYVAAYFAFEGASDSQPESVSIWAVNIRFSQLLQQLVDFVRIDNFGDGVRFNVRSAEQMGESMRVLTASAPLETLLRPALMRIDLPASERESALVDLDGMLINRRTLFRDLDGAARLAAIRSEYR